MIGLEPIASTTELTYEYLLATTAQDFKLQGTQGLDVLLTGRKPGRVSWAGRDYYSMVQHIVSSRGCCKLQRALADAKVIEQQSKDSAASKG